MLFHTHTTTLLLTTALACILLKPCRPFTVTTFNMLAPVHRSMDAMNTRESERDEWWRPRAEAIADFVADKLSGSDVVLLQEWWFRDDFSELFDRATGHLFDRVAERRPGIPNFPREDGMAVLVKKTGKLELLESQKILTGPQRIAQLVHCRERGPNGRSVRIANCHLSFPSSADHRVNDRRQASEIMKVARALEKAPFDTLPPAFLTPPGIVSQTHLELIGGDFNSDSGGLAATKLEEFPPGFVNCASASAEQALSSTGGKVNLGVTHCTHRGEQVSVDHIFARVVSNQPSRSSRCSALWLGYLDTDGTRVRDCYRGELKIKGKSVISDHRPVTATLEWPSRNGIVQYDSMASRPLDPLEPPSYMGSRWNATGAVTLTRP